MGRRSEGCSESAVNPVDGRLFLYFNDAASDSHVLSYALDANGVPDPASRWDVLFVDQPGIGHKGGGIIFDENGVMMLALGDGGGSRGRAAGLQQAARRHHPHHSADERPWLRHPGGQPVHRPGGHRSVVRQGLAQPVGLCRDAATGDMWITDVGEDTVEEVNPSPPAPLA